MGLRTLGDAIVTKHWILTAVLLLPAMAMAATPEPPTTVPVVTTLLDDHRGWVGGVSVDQLGFLYVADFHESVWRLNPASGEIELYADGFYGASGNTLDRNGNLYQASFYGHTISRIARSGEAETIVDKGLNGPVGMTFNPDGDLLVCNCNDRRILKVDADGQVTEFATSEYFICPNGITLDPDGNAYVVSFSGSKVIKITPDGETSVFADSKGKGLGHITYLRGIFYATSFQDNKVYRISPSGEITVLAGTGERGGTDGPGAEATFSNPNGVVADPSGTYLYINDYVGPAFASGLAATPFSVRRIELPSLTKTLDYSLTHQSIEEMRKAYRAFVASPTSAGESTLAPMNQLGWRYLQQGKTAEAVALFELNAETHPDSWRVFSSLGAGYMRVGEKKKAIKVLEKSLELNPDNTIALGRLKELGAR